MKPLLVQKLQVGFYIILDFNLLNLFLFEYLEVWRLPTSRNMASNTFEVSRKSILTGFFFEAPRFNKYRGGRMPTIENIDPSKSVAALYPLLILEWHPTKNSELKWTLWEVTHGSRKEAWWLCPECGYESEREIRSRAGERTGCPECATKRRQKNSTPKPGQSFGNIYPQYVAEWHPDKNNRSPMV